MDQGNRLLRFRRKRKLLAPMREACNLSELVGELPSEGDSLRLISFCSFSAVGFVRWVADQHVIRWMGVTTFRVGPRCIKLLRQLHDGGRLLDADFILGRLAGSRDGAERKIFDQLDTLCREAGWRCRPASNHTKVILFNTDAGRWVLETSCNLNDAPNWEQYTLEQDDDLYQFYKDLFFSSSSAEPVEETEPTETSEEGWIWQGDGSLPSL